MPRFSIPVNQYASPKYAPGPPVILAPCIINDRQLNVAIVRSVLTHHPGRIARRFTAAIVRPTLLFILDWTRPPDFSLNPLFNLVTRDFSITTRIGELAQGVAYSYWHWHRGYRIVTDFASFADQCGFVTPPGLQVPDFIMYNPITDDIALMEAKGTRNANHTQPMANAMRQCRAALAYAPALRSYGCALTLDTPAGSGTLHVRDPERLTRVSLSLKHDLFRHSYASWFELAGFQRIAEWCRKPLREAGRLERGALTGEQSNSKDPLRQVLAQSLGFNPEIVTFEIAPEVAAALTDRKQFRKLDWERFKVSSVEDSERLGSPVYFPDGTSIT